jgi:Terpene synthase family 2, C-terminal metal binding
MDLPADFYMPYPERVNPHAEEVRRLTLSWVEKMGITTTPEEQRQLDAYRLDLYTSRCRPDLSADNLTLVNQWITWSTVVDDRCELGSPQEVDRFTGELVDLLNAGVPSRVRATDGAFVRALGDLLDHCAPVMSPRWYARLVNDVAAWLVTYPREARDRRDNVIMSPDQYLEHRAWTTSTHHFLTLTELGLRMELPEEFVSTPLMRAIRRVISEHMGLANDVLGLEREEARQDPINYVLVLEHQHHYDRETALSEVIRLTNERVWLYELLEKAVPSTCARQGLTERQGEQALIVVTALREWMRGNYEWHLHRDGTRYDPEGVSLAGGARPWDTR